MSFTIKATVSDERLNELLCAGMEGGIGYWARVIGYEGDTKGVEYKHLDMPFKKGGAVLMVDVTGQGGIRADAPGAVCSKVACYEGHIFKLGKGKKVKAGAACPKCGGDLGYIVRLNRVALQRGLNLLPEKSPFQTANFLNENEDANTGDVFIQLCVLGEIVFG